MSWHIMKCMLVLTGYGSLEICHLAIMASCFAFFYCSISLGEVVGEAGKAILRCHVFDISYTEDVFGDLPKLPLFLFLISFADASRNRL